MVAPGEDTKTTTTTVVLPSPTLRTGTTDGRTPGKQNLSIQDKKQATPKVKNSNMKQHVSTHGLHHLQHFACDSPVRFMMYFEIASMFIGLHSDNTVSLYEADGRRKTSLTHFPFMGLTNTKISGCLVGWGPGPVLTLLDSELHPLDAAHDALDIQVCQAAEHSAELVTAGVGNVCMWSVRPMRCKVKIQEGLQHSTFTQMALAPPLSNRPHRAFVACGPVVSLVNLDDGKVLEHKRDLCSGDITAMAYCSQLNSLIIASEELSVRIWGPEWELRMAFVGHDGVVNSLFCCPGLSMLLTASADCTIRCWNMEVGDVVECVHTEQKHPLLCVGGSSKGDVLFSFSHQGVDFWEVKALYTLLSKLKRAPLRQILVSPFPAPYPSRVLCLSGDSDISLVAAETGTVLTSFKAEQKILCVDYCLQKEILLALTETGTVLQANTLTNPITLMQTWEGRGQGLWQRMDHVTESVAQNLPIPGPACCLVLYSCVAETQVGFQEWRNLQEKGRCSHRNKKALDDAKNRFLIVLGQSRGYVTVLEMDNGSVLYQMPAHDGQRVTAMQVHPENSCLLSTGEDMTVVLWRVNPYAQECLSQQLSLHCGQPVVYLAAVGSQLALTFQEASSGTYSLKLFNLLNQHQTDYSATEGHSDHFTGLCACPDLEVFVSSSLDGTVCIWNKENDLIRTLQLNAVPECLASSGLGGTLFLGIRGDLYVIKCEKFLPHTYQQMADHTYCAEPVPESTEQNRRRKNTSTNKDAEEGLPAIASNLSWTKDECRKEYENIVTFNQDLAALLQGSVKCNKGKPPSTKETRNEAFDRYMKIIYRLPPNIKLDLEDIFHSDNSFCPEPPDNTPCNLPAIKEDVRPESILNIAVNVEKKKSEKRAPAANPKTKTLMKVKPWPVATPTKPDVEEKDEVSPVIICPPEQTQALVPNPLACRHKTPTPPPHCLKTPTPPPHRLKTPTPLPQPEPTPEVPAFLRQFAEAAWFKELCLDNKHIPSSLSPEAFSLQLLGPLTTCSAVSQIQVLAALQALHQQGLLQSTDRLHQGLIDLMANFVRAHMSPEERSVLVEILNLLVSLKSVCSDFMKKLLALLALKKLGLRETVLHTLTTLGVNEAEQWLCPELESWDSELQDSSDIWKSLQDRADCWLESWIAEYKGSDRSLHPRSRTKRKPPTFGVVDVLNYFSRVQKDEYRKAKCVKPADRKNTVLLPLRDCSSQPIIRLGETYSMARTSRPPSLRLPPLRNRPFLLHFPSFISLPLPRVTLRPFHIYSDEDWVKVSARRYFIHQQSFIDYYK